MPDKIDDVCAVGRGESNLVLIHLEDWYGAIKLTPRQARLLARMLVQHASQAEYEMTKVPR
jgi:hypothetical protein